MLEFGTPQFWVAAVEIILINIVLSGDNAVVIALACRDLPPKQKKLGIFWGIFGAVILRVVLTYFAVGLLQLPWLKVIGGVLLFWIGIKLLVPEADDGSEVAASEHLMGAIRTVIVADLVMSLDNVIGVAAAAKGSLVLLVFGLAVSIPLIVLASQLIMKLMERYPIVVTLGAGLLGFVAGEMIVEDQLLHAWVEPYMPGLATISGIAGAACVVAIGHVLARRSRGVVEREVI